jgi:hypothetical protein
MHDEIAFQPDGYPTDAQGQAVSVQRQIERAEYPFDVIPLPKA